MSDPPRHIHTGKGSKARNLAQGADLALVCLGKEDCGRLEVYGKDKADSKRQQPGRQREESDPLPLRPDRRGCLLESGYGAAHLVEVLFVQLWNL